MNVAVMPTERATLLDAEDQVTAALRGKRGLKPAQPNNFAIVTQDRVSKRSTRSPPDSSSR